MPWKECSVMDERLRFIGRLLDGEEMSAICREFSISRKTGHKIYNRYSEHGLEALTDRTRRRRSLRQSAARADRGHDPCLQARENTLGCAQNPRDADQALAFTAFERLFSEYGLPDAIRSDNGVPFASPNGLFNLSKLSVWFLRLGIAIERIQPGKPQQNGWHERMHLTLKQHTTRPPGMNIAKFKNTWTFKLCYQGRDCGPRVSAKATLTPGADPGPAWRLNALKLFVQII